MAFSTKRDNNNVPAIFGVSSIDLVTPTAIKVNPATGAMFIDGTSLYTGLDTRYLQINNNLSDINSNSAARSNLGLGTIATQNANNVSITGGSISGLSSPIPIASGGTNNASAYTAGSVIFSDGSKLTQNNSNLYWDNTFNKLGIGTNSPAYTLDVNGASGKLRSFIYILGKGPDLSLIPVAGGQSVLTSYWSLQIVGNKQGNVDYSPSNFGNMDDASVIIPNQQSGKIGLIIAGATSQSGNLQEWRNVSSTTQAAIGPTGKISNYNAIATAGQGVPSIYGQGRSTGQTGGVTSVATYTVGSADGSFLVSANVNVTAYTAGTITVTCAYTDEGNTARTLTFSFSNLTGTLLSSIGATGPYEGLVMHIRAKAATAITIATTVSLANFTYNVEGYITQIG
jgi:hypothetical protein